MNKLIGSLKGSLISIDVTDDVKEMILRNKNINGINVTENKKLIANKKSISFNKFKKIGSYNHMIVHTSSFNRVFEVVLKDSILIVIDSIIIYGNVNADLLERRFKRYNCVISKYKDNVYIIDVKNKIVKKKFLNDIKDFINNKLIILEEILIK